MSNISKCKDDRFLEGRKINVARLVLQLEHILGRTECNYIS